MRLTMDQIENKPLRYIDTGKVKIGIYYTPKPATEIMCDMEVIQHRLLPKPIGPLNPWPSLREMIRYWMR
jgi:hypothetical protein